MQLGHEAYRAGMLAHSKLVEEFGEGQSAMVATLCWAAPCKLVSLPRHTGILGVDGEIDRSVLGAVVFADKVCR